MTVRRFSQYFTSMEENTDGNYVLYEDYAKLEAKIETLEDELIEQGIAHEMERDNGP